MRSSQEPSQHQEPLGEKVVTPRPVEPEWKPWGSDRNFEVNTAGQARTKNYPYPKAPS